MKNIILLIAVFSIGTASASAQSDSVKEKNNFFRFNMKEKISYEILTGVNFSNISTNIPTDDGFREYYEKHYIGLNLGVLVNLPFLENIYFQTGLLLSKMDKSLSGIEYPFLISYNRNIKPNLKWNLNVGPYVNYIWGKHTYYDDEISDNEFGLIVGTRIYYKKIYLGMQYNLGLTGGFVMNYHYSPYPYDINAKFNSFSVNIGYKL
jgi:hypothetical protein